MGDLPLEQGAWDPEISVSVITMLGVPAKKDLSDIGMKSRNVVIHMEWDVEETWVKLLGEVRPTQSVDQWVDWLTNPNSGYEVPSINWLIEVLPGTNKKLW